MYKKIPSVYMCVYVCMYMVGLEFYVIKIPAEYLKAEVILSQLWRLRPVNMVSSLRYN